MDRVEVSDEMLAFIGGIPAPCGDWPADPITIAFRLRDSVECEIGTVSAVDTDLTFVVARQACVRIFGDAPTQGRWHLPAKARVIALEICDCGLPETARSTLRLGKSIELLCAICSALIAGEMVPMAEVAEFSELDTRRLVAARRMIDECWNEPLTLERIGRACGLNRDKLTRGFRALYSCTVGEALSERRLSEACAQLRSTELPVSTIGFRSGYANNASFSRAFGRRFGMSPTAYRMSA